MIIMTMNLCLSTSLFPSLTSHHPPCLSTPPDWGVLCRFIPRQMASNSRYPPREPHEEVLDTARLPELQGGACAKERGPNRFVHNSDSSLNARSGSKQMERSARGKCWGSEGRRVGEGKSTKRERGRYQESRFLTDLVAFVR